VPDDHHQGKHRPPELHDEGGIGVNPGKKRYMCEEWENEYQSVRGNRASPID